MKEQKIISMHTIVDYGAIEVLRIKTSQDGNGIMIIQDDKKIFVEKKHILSLIKTLEIFNV